jgi:hypothetical protein
MPDKWIVPPGRRSIIPALEAQNSAFSYSTFIISTLNEDFQRVSLLELSRKLFGPGFETLQVSVFSHVRKEYQN